MEGFAEFKGNFLAPSAQRSSDMARILQQWKAAWAAGSRGPSDELLLNRDGSFQLAIIRRLLAERDNRPLALAE